MEGIGLDRRMGGTGAGTACREERAGQSVGLVGAGKSDGSGQGWLVGRVGSSVRKGAGWYVVLVLEKRGVKGNVDRKEAARPVGR